MTTDIITMRPDMGRYELLLAKGRLVIGEFGDGIETACALSAFAGVRSFEDCPAKGLPQEAGELIAWLFDNAPREERVAWGYALGVAIRAAAERQADWPIVRAEIRHRAILPIAARSIGDGDEPWRVECRAVVQLAQDDPMAVGDPAEAARAAAAGMAARDAGAAWAARAARAAGAAGDAGAAAVREIYEATCAALQGSRVQTRPITTARALALTN